MKHQTAPSLPYPYNAMFKNSGVAAFAFEGGKKAVLPYHLNDCYKVFLLTAECGFPPSIKGSEVESATLFIEQPHGSYCSKLLSGEQNGYACFIIKAILSTTACSKGKLLKRLFFRGVNTLAYSLSKEQCHFLVATFRKLLEEHDTSYVFKADLVQDYIDIILHEALKMNHSGYDQTGSLKLLTNG